MLLVPESYRYVALFCDKGNLRLYEAESGIVNSQLRITLRVSGEISPQVVLVLAAPDRNRHQQGQT